MKVLIAPASFKGSFLPDEAAQIMAESLKRIRPDWSVQICPLCDGGEGTRAAWGRLNSAETRFHQVPDWSGKTRLVPFGWLVQPKQKSAWIESADMLGWHLSKARNPMQASSLGLGLLLQHVLQLDPDQIFFGLGGTLSVDAGLGLLAGLGGGFFHGKQAIHSPAEWAKDCTFCKPSWQSKAQLTAICDVNNPLLGPAGARMYMAQKGVNSSQGQRLEAIYRQMAKAMDPSSHFVDLPGSGAAGGLGFSLASLGFELRAGSSFWARQVHLDQLIADCDLVISGEGQIDRQSWHGKPLGHLAQICQTQAKPLYALGGQINGPVPWMRSQALGGYPPYADFSDRITAAFSAWFSAF